MLWNEISVQALLNRERQIPICYGAGSRIRTDDLLITNFDGAVNRLEMPLQRASDTGLILLRRFSLPALKTQDYPANP